MLRNLLSVIAGMLLTFVTVMLFEWLGHRVWTPAKVDWSNAVAATQYMNSLPVAAYLWLLLGWLVAVAVGLWCAYTLSNKTARWPQWSVAVLFIASTTMNFFLVPHPYWFAAVTLVMLLAISWAVIKIQPLSKGTISHYE
jgi:hypothetical protein